MSAFHKIVDTAAQVLGSVNEFVNNHKVEIGLGLTAAGVLFGPEVPATIGAGLYLLKEASAISYLPDVIPTRSPSPRISPSNSQFQPIDESDDDEFHTPSQSPEFYSLPSNPIDINGYETPTPDLSRSISPVVSSTDSAISVSPNSEVISPKPSKIPRLVKRDKAPAPIVQQSAVSASAVTDRPLSSSSLRVPSRKNTLDTFIDKIKNCSDKSVLAKLKNLTVFGFQNQRERIKLGEQLGVDLGNMKLATDSIERIRVVADRRLTAI